MTPIELIGGAILLLYVWRRTLRWAIRKDYPNGVITWKAFVGELLTTTFLFPLAVALMLVDRSMIRIKPHQAVRLVAGESRSDKRAREVAEHEKRAKALGMPVS